MNEDEKIDLCISILEFKFYIIFVSFRFFKNLCISILEFKSTKFFETSPNLFSIYVFLY